MKIIHCYFDETELIIDGNKCLALAGVFIEDEYVESIRESLLELKAHLLDDQFTGKKEKSRIFHFAEDTQGIKSIIIDSMRDKEYRAYIAYKDLNTTYSETYISIVEKILYDRLQEKYYCKFQIYFEQNNKVNQVKMGIKMENMITRIRENHPDLEFPSLEKVTKDNILSAIPDYVLGVFRSYHQIDRAPYMGLNFDKLRNKIRLIVDMKNGMYYSRSKPYIIHPIQKSVLLPVTSSNISSKSYLSPKSYWFRQVSHIVALSKNYFLKIISR
ncbi:hypothetical protein [Sulfuricurvum sp.]|uniref:hypothetical protein n=1 Tax=Sulfuricurvum sp. TaxID=2025608 RepID=UPI003BAE6A45